MKIPKLFYTIHKEAEEDVLPWGQTANRLSANRMIEPAYSKA